MVDSQRVPLPASGRRTIGVPYERPPERLCVECGTLFAPKRIDQVFHSPACKLAEKNRRFLRGVKLYPWVMLMVTNNKRRGEALNAITGAARRWRDEDRKQGRLPPPVNQDWP